MKGLLFAFGHGLRDTVLVLRRAALLAIHVGLTSILVGMGAGLAAQSIQDISSATRLGELDAAYFVLGDRSVKGDLSTGPLRTELADRLTGDSYAFTVEPATNGSRKKVIVYGGFLKAFGIDGPDLAPPYALAGSQTGVPIGSVVTVGGRSIPVAGTMKATGYLDLWMEYSSLDDAVVVVGDVKSDLSEVSDEVLFDLSSRLVLVKASTDNISSYMSVVRQHLPLFPRWVNDKVRLDFGPELTGRAAFLAVFMTGLLATVVGAATGVRALVQSRFRDLVIHMSLGATSRHVAARLSAFVITAWLAPSLVMAAIGLRIVAEGRHLATVFPWLLLLAVLIAGSITVQATAKVMRADMLAQAREAVW